MSKMGSICGDVFCELRIVLCVWYFLFYCIFIVIFDMILLGLFYWLGNWGWIRLRNLDKIIFLLKEDLGCECLLV